MIYIAFVCFLLSFCYAIYRKKQCPQNALIYAGKKYKATKEIRHMAVMAVGVNNDEYYATGILDEDGRKLTIPIDKDLMEIIPVSKGENENERIADVLVYEELSLLDDKQTTFELTPNEIRFKWDLTAIRGKFTDSEELLRMQRQCCWLLRLRNVIFACSVIPLYFHPFISFLLNFVTFYISFRFVLPEGCTKPKKSGIIKKSESAPPVKPVSDTDVDEDELPGEYGNWSETLRYLYLLNRNIQRSAAKLLKSKKKKRQAVQNNVLDNSIQNKTEEKTNNIETNVDVVKEKEPESPVKVQQKKTDIKEPDPAEGFFSDEDMEAENQTDDSEDDDPFGDLPMNSGSNEQPKEFDPSSDDDEFDIFGEEEQDEYEPQEEIADETDASQTANKSADIELNENKDNIAQPLNDVDEMQDDDTEVSSASQPANETEQFVIEVLEQDSDDIEILPKNAESKPKDFTDMDYKELPATPSPKKATKNSKNGRGNKNKKKKNMTAEIFATIMGEEQ